jgi:hypothetical protein
MRKVAVICAIAATTATGALVYWISRQGELITKQQKRIDFLSSRASSDSFNQLQVKLDEECAKQAARTFQEEKARWWTFVTNEADYQSHYCRKRHKCFVLIIRRAIDTAGKVSFHRMLKDAHEQKAYGIYNSVYGSIDCHVFPEGDPKNSRDCKSEAEFDEFVRQYMND